MVDTALYYYAEAYKLQPFNIKYVSSYATRLLNQKNYRTTDSILNIFLAIDSTSVPAINLAVRSLYEQDNYRLTSSFSNRWLNIKPDEINVSTTIRLAIANYELKNYLLGYKLCDTVIRVC